MGKLAPLCCWWAVLLSWVVARHVAGQPVVSQVDNFLNDKENKVQLLGRHALFLQLAAESTDCGLSNCVDKCSRHSCSPTTKDKFTCIKAPKDVPDCKDPTNSSASCEHLKVDFTGNGFVRVPPQFQNFSNLSPELTRAICAQTNLQFSASSESIITELTFWNYYGSAEGAWRTYPGREADPEKGCIEYDPRKRPWYITAVSVVKDLVVLLDTGQVDSSTFTLSKTVIQELFGTFRPADRVNLVSFDSTRATLLRPASVDVQVNQSQAALLSNFDISSLTNGQQGFSNITSGFELARLVFNSTSELKMIVVLTDGKFVENPVYNDPALQQLVTSLSLEGVVVFFFSLGNDTNKVPDPLTELRQLSCRMNSTVNYVSLVDAQRNPLWAIRPYFDYQAALRFAANSTFWTDTYEDFDGLGRVATVTYPVLNEGILHGVAGIDVIVNTDDAANAIRRRLIDANVASVPLACQLNQVNLSRCTKPVESHDQALCPQTLYRNESPGRTYLKNLCCDNCEFKDPPPRDITTVLLASIIPGPVVLIAVILTYFFLRRRAARTSIRETKEDFARQSISTNQYTYKELKSATQKFHQDNKLGEGGFGEVYQGTLKNGTVVAVKKLSANSKQGAREFLNEVIVISRVQHRNLVELRGCCVEKHHRLLVYEYLENRSLRQSLLGGPKEAMDIDWQTRFNIALGTARGLAYLHFEVTPRIIHRDIKASNVLLDRNLEAKIADFGLAKLFPEEQSHFTTNVAGTLGYVAPEYVTRGILTEKVDVYSFGVVLMEIVTGEVNMKRTPSGSLLFLVDRVRCMYKQSQRVGDDQVLLNLVDSRLDTNFDKDQAIRVFKTSLLCTLDNPDLRPTSPRAILMLLGSELIAEHDLEPVVKLEYSKSLHAAEFGENEVWSDAQTPSVPSSRE
ncbi:hypothetical protein KC19_VG339300 [Ceratodon purpureus]|uniref:Protein kinase domain-containing protein n=1 Tax=Ceratodon purpureus TaxID=3225 RepID=A0A8T0HWV8_CERPU|nr:hypothetical protein KC19_VG339300 [Ceratodon purpureus]